MKRIILASIACLCLWQAKAAEPIAIPLWPEVAPVSNGLPSDSEKGPNEWGWITDVSVPVLYVYPAEKPNGSMVIACPGGAYGGLASWHEGSDWAEWMNERGTTFAVLKYRMPCGHREVPVEDGRRAMEIARERAASWGVDTRRIGVMGFSAGGHFAASLANLYGDAPHRPDFQILFYPVITMGPATHEGSRDNLLGKDATQEAIEAYSLEKRVTKDTPAAFIVLAADDDVVPAVNSLDYAKSLVDNGVKVDLHVYPKGGHGWGFRDSFPSSAMMKAELEAWLSRYANAEQ